MNCKNCNTEVLLNYCPNCGQAAKLKRVDSHYILHEIVHVLHFEKGILYTIRELFINPGKSIREFLGENRNRLVKPIFFIIVASLIYSAINHFFHIEGTPAPYAKASSATAAIYKWVQDNYGYSNIIMGLFIALWVKLFFRKHRYNFFEILILLCFSIGMGMLVYSLFGILAGLTHYEFMNFAALCAIIYASWAIGDFFDRKKVLSYIKAFFAYVLGMLTFSFLALIVGKIIDAFLK